jgi:hypothetical protein
MTKFILKYFMEKEYAISDAEAEIAQSVRRWIMELKGGVQFSAEA